MDAVMDNMSDAGNCYGNKIVPELSGQCPILYRELFLKEVYITEVLNIIFKRCVKCGLLTNV